MYFYNRHINLPKTPWWKGRLYATSVLYIGILACMLLSSCYKKERVNPECVTHENVSFKEDIWPIVQTNCAVAGCHVENFEPGNYNQFEVFQDKAKKGLLREKLIAKAMPPPWANRPPLPPCDSELILTWVEEGYLDN